MLFPVSNVTPFVGELPDANLSPEPLAGDQAIDVPGRAITQAGVADLELFRYRFLR